MEAIALKSDTQEHNGNDQLGELIYEIYLDRFLLEVVKIGADRYLPAITLCYDPYNLPRAKKISLESQRQGHAPEVYLKPHGAGYGLRSSFVFSPSQIASCAL